MKKHKKWHKPNLLKITASELKKEIMAAACSTHSCNLGRSLSINI